MLHNNKSFDPSLCQKYDGPGRTAVLGMLSSLYGAELESLNDESGGCPADGFWDLAVKFPGVCRPVKVEVEFSQRFHFLHKPEILVPQRKWKNKADLFAAINDDNAWLCFAKHVHKAPVVTIRTRYGDEQFFAVPWEKGYLSRKTDGNWSKLYRWSKRQALGL